MPTLTRSRSGRFTSRRRPTTRRRSVARVRKNPPKMTTAMKRKISLAIKRRWKSGTYAKLRKRSSSTKVARRSRPSTTRAVARSRRQPVFRRLGNLRVRVNPPRSKGIIGGLLRTFQGAISKDTLMKAGGAISASIGTGYILRQFGAQIPFAGAQYGKAFYSLAIPVTAAWVLRKQRALAEGLVIGGLVMAVTEIIRKTAPVQIAGTLDSYPNNSQISPLPGFGLAGELGQFSAYPGADLNSMGAPLQTDPFPTDAWN